MNLEHRVPPLLVVALAGCLAWLITQIVAIATLELSVRFALAAAFGMIGVACCLLGVEAFRRARTTVNPLTPTATTALVKTGIFEITRNPMYLGFVLLLLAEVAWLGNIIALGLVPACVGYLNRFQIAPEERALRVRFGPEYVSYSAHVRRWI